MHVIHTQYTRAEKRARFNQLKRKFVKYSRHHGHRVRNGHPPSTERKYVFALAPSLKGRPPPSAPHGWYESLGQDPETVSNKIDSVKEIKINEQTYNTLYPYFSSYAYYTLCVLFLYFVWSFVF